MYVGVQEVHTCDDTHEVFKLYLGVLDTMYAN